MSDYPELRKLQNIIDNQADRILDLEAALRKIVDSPFTGETAWRQSAKIARAALASADGRSCHDHPTKRCTPDDCCQSSPPKART